MCSRKRSVRSRQSRGVRNGRLWSWDGMRRGMRSSGVRRRDVSIRVGKNVGSWSSTSKCGKSRVGRTRSINSWHGRSRLLGERVVGAEGYEPYRF